MIPKKNYCRQIRWTALLLVLVLAGCAATVRAKAGQTVSTALFDFTVSEAQLLAEYPGVTVPEDRKLISLAMTVTNTGTGTLPVFAGDFQFQWGEGESDSGNCLDALDDQMMPYARDLAPGESGGGPGCCCGLAGHSAQKTERMTRRRAVLPRAALTA